LWLYCFDDKHGTMVIMKGLTSLTSITFCRREATLPLISRMPKKRTTGSLMYCRRRWPVAHETNERRCRCYLQKDLGSNFEQRTLRLGFMTASQVQFTIFLNLVTDWKCTLPMICEFRGYHTYRISRALENCWEQETTVVYETVENNWVDKILI
jgi:hypothetical protein